MGCKVDQGIPHYQRTGSFMKIGGLAITSTGQRDGVEFGRMGGEMGWERLEESLAVPIVVGVSSDNLNGSNRQGEIVGPDDGIKEDGQLFAEVGGGPEFGFTGGIISVPS